MIEIPQIVMSTVLALLVLLAGISLARVQVSKRQDMPNLLDLLTATDKKGKTRYDARKCFECGAFAVSTWAFVYITTANRMTEWFFVGYMTAWVGARWLRDREKRLEQGPKK